MTAITHSPQRDASQTLAYRLAALLLGVGTLHFVAPKPFDGIIPVELPGSPRFYTYASGVAEVGIGAALLVRSTRRLAALAAAALFVAVFPGNVNMVPAVVGQALADAHHRFGSAAVADSDGDRGPQGRPHRLARRLAGQQLGQLVGPRQRIRDDGETGPDVVKSCAHQRLPTAAECGPREPVHPELNRGMPGRL